MNFRSSSYTGRAARDLNTAFGPYAHGSQIVEKREFDWQDKVVMAGSAVSFVVFVMVMVM